MAYLNFYDISFLLLQLQACFDATRGTALNEPKRAAIAAA